jgi:glycosyltransferase involved in cell wall biosynthesis
MEALPQDARAPSVSVIIPTYNRVRYLGDAIRSVLSQTFTDLELLIVDDGSSDATEELVRAIADPRLHYARLEHRGISAAMNAGLRMARGAFIARLDSDDVWLDEMLELLTGILKAQTEVGVAYGRGQAISVTGTPFNLLLGRAPQYPGDFFRSLIFDDCTCNVAIVARRECFERAGDYDEALIANEDWDMWLRVARHFHFCFVDQVVVLVRWHDGNITSLDSPRFGEVLRQRTLPLDKLFRDPTLPADLRALKSTAYSNVHAFCCTRWLQRRDLAMAAREFREALKVSERPFITALRVGWYSLGIPLLRESAIGRRLIAKVASIDFG